MKKSRSVVALILVILIVAGLSVMAINGIKIGNFEVKKAKDLINLGLDLKGGVYVLLEAQTDKTGDELKKIMEQSKAIIVNRVDGLGVAEPNIQIEGENRLRIELAGLQDSEEALNMIGQTAQLQFVDSEGKVILTGENVKDSQVQFANQSQAQIGQNVMVSLELDKTGSEAFYEATKRLASSRGVIAILLDDNIISAPAVNDPIPDGKAVITGDFTVEEASRLATLIRAGALPVEMKVLTTDVVGPTLGMDAFDKTVFAGLMAIVFIMLFMIVVYRVPGIVASISLIIYAFLTVYIMIFIKAKLTLPGIAGIVLSIGMAVDSNVIIYERINDEIRAGKTIRSAVDSGFDRALGTIIDSNVTTLIAGIVLTYFGVGAIRGFGVTLIIGIIAVMFTAVVLSKHILKIFLNVFDNLSNRAFGVRG